MIVTVTINPSVDRTIQLPSRLVRDAVLRASAVTSQAAGKGVNVSRALTHASIPTRAIVRADYHDPYVRELVESGLAVVTVDPGATVRTNISLAEPDGTTTKINEPGSPLSAAAVAALHDVVAAEAPRASWLVLAGSPSPGRRCRTARRSGTDGADRRARHPHRGRHLGSAACSAAHRGRAD